MNTYLIRYTGTRDDGATVTNELTVPAPNMPTVQAALAIVRGMSPLTNLTVTAVEAR